jgi:hypothetical protein
MLNIIDIIKEIHRKSLAKKSVDIMASACPIFFELLGYDVIKGDVTAEHWNYNKIDYEAFKEIWEKRYKKKLPKYSALTY